MIDALTLPPQARQQLCLDILGEIGARNVSVNGDEIVHSCTLPFGRHPNGDRNPSASINWEKMVYSCWVCGGGGFLWWLATVKGFAHAGAAKQWVADKTGLSSGDPDTLMAFLDALDAPKQIERRVIPRYDAKVLEPWRMIHPYLTEFRGIRRENIIDLNVGYGTLSIPMGDGKFQKSERIIVPHFWRGDLVGWQSRRLADDGTPKYQSTPEFPKDITLYNFDAHAPCTVVVESPMSVIARHHQAHVEATFGAMLTFRQMDLIAQHRSKIILFFDNDPAGWKATDDAGQYLLPYSPDVWAVQNPYAADPADLDDDTFAQAITEWAIPYVLWRAPNPATLKPWEVRRGNQEVRNGQGPS